MSDSNWSDLSIDETLRQRFEAAWVEGRPEPIERFLPDEKDPKYLATLEELVHIELEFAWKSHSASPSTEDVPATSDDADNPPRVESYLHRFPQLDQPEIVLRLLQQECFVRRAAGELVAIEEYGSRFPEVVTAGSRFESLLRTMQFGHPDFFSQGTGVDGRGGGRAADRTLPRQFGGYELLEEIGRGGMGVVYRARQCSADRIVALKVVRRDLMEMSPPDTQMSAMDRFRHEAQAAARLDHDNLVTVYEVGQIEGEPFFSMRYVEGPSLGDMLRDGPIPNRRAAVYIESVARAVHQAHVHGILHRDLKPKNILVDQATDRAMVADFGLAKLIENQEDLTQSGEVMGSPPYMSPEQAKDSSRVTTQTDVYALGATLYHILTGRPPFHAATVLQTLQHVIEEEPVRPRQLNPAIEPDLETICLKCLEKEPAGRYASAGTLADDLARYLAGEPILARPIGPMGRTLRWCRRNPTVAALISSTVTFLVLALVASVVGYVKTSAALTDAETGYRHARQTVDDFFTRVSEDTLLNQPGMQPLRRELLQQALEYYQSFLDEQGDDPAVQDELAGAHFRVGWIIEKTDSPEAAMASYRRAAAMQEQLLAERPDDLGRLEALGDTLNAIGRALYRQNSLEEARDAHQHAVDIRGRLLKAAPGRQPFGRKLANSYMNIAMVDQKLSRLDDARRQFEKAQAIREEVLVQDPDSLETRRDLAMGFYNLGVLALSRPVPELNEAHRSFERGAAIFEELLAAEPDDLDNQYRLSLCSRMLADVKCGLEDWEGALALYKRALEQLDTLARLNPEVPEYQAELAALYMNVAGLEGSETNVESLEHAADILEKLVNAYPSVARYQRDLAVTLRAIAACRSSAGQNEEARAAWTAARKHIERLVEKFPGNADFGKLLDETNAAYQPQP